MKIKKTPKKRADQCLVDMDLVPSKSKAQELIRAGGVSYCTKAEWWPLKKAGHLFAAPYPAFKISDNEILKYVSRGGLKLEKALKTIGLKVRGMTALDVGISTGGFTDCLLQSGAKHVTGIDVARNELAPQLRAHPQVHFWPALNARELKKYPEMRGQKFDLIVVDVSFISLAKVLPELYDFLHFDGHLLALVKPQFEVGPKNLDKRGVVRSPAEYEKVEKRICELAESLGLQNEKYFACALKGGDGNQEFFLYAKKVAGTFT